MPISLVRATRKKYLSLLIFGGPGTQKSRLASSFPDGIIVDAHRSLDTFGESLNARLLRTSNPNTVHELIAMLRQGKEQARSLIIDGGSRIWDEIEATTPEGRSYFTNKRHRLTELTDAGRALPMHFIMTLRSKNEYAKAGEVVNNFLVGSEDKIISGRVPDIDGTLLYDFDLTLETFISEDHTPCARVVSSHLPGLPIGLVIEHPEASTILALAKIEHDAPVDYAKIEPSDKNYGNNAHLYYLAVQINDRANRVGADRLSLQKMLVQLNVYDGTRPLDIEQRRKAVEALEGVLANDAQVTATATTAATTSPVEGPVNTQLSENASGDQAPIAPSEGTAVQNVEPTVSADPAPATESAGTTDEPSYTPEQQHLVENAKREIEALPPTWRAKFFEQFEEQFQRTEITFLDLPWVHSKLSKARAQTTRRAS